MFKICKAIQKNVNQGYFIESGNLYYYSEGKIVEYSLRDESVLMEKEINIDLQKIVVCKGSIVSLSNQGIVIFFNDFTIKKKIDRSIGYFEILRCKFFVITVEYDYKLFLPTQGLLDTNDEIIWRGETGDNLFFVKGEVLSLSKIQVSLLGIKSGKKKWTLNFSEANSDYLIKVHGLDHNILVVGIEKIDRIFGIDIRTGKILWEKRAITSGKKLDKEKRVIHSFLINYTQLSLETGEEIKSFADRDYFEEVGIETQRNNFVVVGDHIITTDSRKGKIGAFNTNTGRFDWVHEVEGVSFPGGREIVYSAPYLFVHDSNGALHIFEKES